ncbi:N-acetylglucosamine-6-phosphate deacetylase [Spirosoma montaniterrae]|uniref:N-acetylglucosamine-6-phosphate deacetylase n=1 Tax=Spirosoma montaniterrae TaxID=1178516 RepID=A0A1P9WS56_9BACT|nr:N-acetylglucosamine-6-phosphate deacetylase [Spirosoma montaniterrae]AQG78216.1 N-acetylglucosamine-6-phosphate deacetylase [Spirosoma montaniterrae]
MNRTGRETPRLKLINGRILTPQRIIPNGTILMAGGTIVDVVAGDLEVPGAEVLDVGGAYVSPGFIDLHVHGGGGHDFMDGTEEAFLQIAQIHARYGTTALVPTTLTSRLDELVNTLSVYERANARNTTGACFLGMHLEGPYFAMNQRGAQNPRYIRDPDPAEYREILESSSAIARWSAAPERPGALAFGDYLRSKGVLASIAHTDALYEDVASAVAHGYRLVTHLYSCMNGVSRRNGFRYAGAIEGAYLHDELAVELIADGVHLPGPLLQLAYKIKGPDGCALITDAMRAAGMPPGPSVLGSLHDGLDVIVEDGVAKLPDRQAFAGSVATADQLLQTILKLTDIPLLDAVQMMSCTPARIMGVATRKGELRAGYDADLVVLDNQFSVQLTVVGGQVVFRREATPISV